MEDIEDVLAEAGGIHGDTPLRGERAPVVVPRRRTKGTSEGSDGASTSDKHGALVPGEATIFMHTFGCGHNVSDGEYMAGLLAEAGYGVTDEFGSADAYLINSCTVKNPSEEHFVTMLQRAKSSGKPVVVAGCVPQGDPNRAEWCDVSVVGVRHIDRVVSVVEESMRGHVVRLGLHEGSRRHTAHEAVSRQDKTDVPEEGDAAASPPTDGIGQPHGHNTALSHRSLPPLALPKIRRNPRIEIIPINVGCLNACTYCKTKHARGNLQSWPVEAIVNRVREVLQDQNIREIRLTSEDVGAYGLDIGTDVVVLLRAMATELEGTDVMLRLGMSNPPYIMKHLAALGQLLAHPNIYSFIHVPVQSGSNVILDAMKREYTVEEFSRCVDALSAAVTANAAAAAAAPTTCATSSTCAAVLTVATDIICAFPGEGPKEWVETMSLVRKYRFPVLNISRFYPRRGTPAAAMKPITTNIAKDRTRELTELFNGYHTHDGLLGSRHLVNVVELAQDGHHVIGHTKAFVQVLIDPSLAQLGDRVDVEIVACSKFSLTGKVIRKLSFVGSHRPSFPIPLPDAPRSRVVAATEAAESRGLVADASSPPHHPSLDPKAEREGGDQSSTLCVVIAAHHIVAAAVSLVVATVWWLANRRRSIPADRFNG